MGRLIQPIRSRKTTAAVAAACCGATAIATTLVLSNPAQAIPAAQSGCELSNIAMTARSGFIPFTSPRTVTVNSPTTVKAEVVADVGVDAGAEVRLAWSVNFSTPSEGSFGPANFANHAEFFESRATFGLINVPAGTTTIQPFVRLSGSVTSPEKRGNLLHRCSTIEASTS